MCKIKSWCSYGLGIGWNTCLCEFYTLWVIYFQLSPMFPLHVHLKAKCWHPALHFRLQGRLPLAWVYCFSKIWCSREWFIFLCKKHVCLFRWKKPGGPFGPAYPFSEPHELRFHSCILHQRVWSHASWLPSEDPLVQFSILVFYSEPHELRFHSCILHQRVWSHE